MTLVTPSQSNPGDEINASKINDPINQLAAVVNGQIDDQNISGVSGSKLADGTVTPEKLTTPVAFRLYLNTSHNTGGSSATLVKYDTKVYDLGNNVDVTTNKGRFTAPYSGVYTFNAAANVASSSNYTNLRLYVNGGSNSAGSQFTTSVSSSTNVSDDIKLNAGDYVEVYIVSQSNSAITASSTYTYFSGHLVGRT